MTDDALRFYLRIEACVAAVSNARPPNWFGLIKGKTLFPLVIDNAVKLE